MSEKQRTITKEVSLEGTGIHSGAGAQVTCRPAPEGTGIVFSRTDLSGSPLIPVSPETIVAGKGSLRCSTIERNGARVATVEHLMAALNGLGIDNLFVDCRGPEIPGLDGSAGPWVELLKPLVAGQDKARACICVREPIFVEEGAASIAVFPSDDLRISYTLDYSHPAVGAQYLQTVVDPDTFVSSLAPARTFCLEEEVENIRGQGLGKGGRYENALVVGKNGVINNKLRFKDEFVRHKILDLLGDLYLLGAPLKARVIACKSGHGANMKMVKKLAQFLPKVRPSPFDMIPNENGAMEIGAIMNILPHRQPFLFVDRILHMEVGKKAVGIKNVTINDYFFEGHFPGKPLMPGVLILEAMAQVGGVMMLSLEENHGKLAFFMAINNAKFRKPVVPGDQVVFEVVAGKVKSRTGMLYGKALVEGKVVAEADLMFAVGD